MRTESEKRTVYIFYDKKEKRGEKQQQYRNVAIVLFSTFRLTHTQISSTNQRAYMKFARRKKRNTYISHMLDDE